MYEDVAILAALVVLFSALAGRVARSWISGPIIFTMTGLLLGPLGLDVLRLPLRAADLQTLAELSLAMVLFSDAAHADLGVVRRTLRLPERLLLIGLPLTIVLGFLLGWAIFPELDLLEVALLATLLAPTDAALGAPVVNSKSMPDATREALNLESGLNDGICVPVVVILLTFAVGEELHVGTMQHIVMVVCEEIGIGVLVGIVVTALAVALLRFATRAGWTSAHWIHVTGIALAALCFAAAQALGGSGFIACFASGLLFGSLQRGHTPDILGAAATTGEVLSLLTWVIFGGPVLAVLLPLMTWQIFLYAVLSLTLIRMVPVYLSLHGSGLTTATKLFVGWFGPRGLATIVFAIIVNDANLPGHATVVVTAACTVLLSVIAHGVTATPLVAALTNGRRDA